VRHDFRLYAHRGCPAELPENTLPGFQRAIDLGVDALELDVHLTRDGHPLVSHDPDATRMGGRAVAWSDLDLRDAQAIDLGRGFVAADGARPFVGRASTRRRSRRCSRRSRRPASTSTSSSGRRRWSRRCSRCCAATRPSSASRWPASARAR
jgi:hypothetical protein